MPAVSPAWKVRRVATGLDYIVSPDGTTITYRANNFTEVDAIFDDSAGDFTNIFSDEDEVQVFIGATKMFHGFVDEIHTRRLPTRKRELQLHIVDWGSYLAAKRIFEKLYWKSVLPNVVFTNTLPKVTDGVDTLTGAGIEALTGSIKQNFIGTYVKDAWYAAAEAGKADFFVDESLDLKAFLTESKELQTGGTTYKIQDTIASLAHEIMVRHDKPYSFASDVSKKYRSVTATSGIVEYFPSPDINAFQTGHYKDDENGKEFSLFYKMGNNVDYSVDVAGAKNRKPAVFESETEVSPATATEAAVNIPTIKMIVGKEGTATAAVSARETDGETFVSFSQKIEDWQEIGFFIKNNLAGQTITAFKLKLQDIIHGGGFWERDIFTYISSAWKFLRFTLPTTIDNSEVYTGVNWTKSLTPTHLDRIDFEPTPLGPYTPDSSISFGLLHLYATRRGIVTGAGNPPTQKIMIDKTKKNKKALSDLATVEQARVNIASKIASCTIKGNTDFRKPAYKVNVDFTTTLGTGRTGLLRMDEIKHYLEDGIHYTDIEFNTSFHRS